MTIWDMGAGRGHYVQYLRERGVVADGMEGAVGIVPLSKGHLYQRDLTQPLSAPCELRDWVMCLEVAEHIPTHLENVFLSNLACSVSRPRLGPQADTPLPPRMA